MHALNLGNANTHLIHLPSECQCRDKSVHWLRPQQPWVSPNTDHAQPQQLGQSSANTLIQPASAETKLNSCRVLPSPDSSLRSRHALKVQPGLGEPLWQQRAPSVCREPGSASTEGHRPSPAGSARGPGGSRTVPS